MEDNLKKGKRRKMQAWEEGAAERGRKEENKEETKRKQENKKETKRKQENKEETGKQRGNKKETKRKQRGNKEETKRKQRGNKEETKRKQRGRIEKGKRKEKRMERGKGNGEAEGARISNRDKKGGNTQRKKKYLKGALAKLVEILEEILKHIGCARVTLHLLVPLGCQNERHNNHKGIDDEKHQIGHFEHLQLLAVHGEAALTQILCQLVVAPQHVEEKDGNHQGNKPPNRPSVNAFVD